MHNNGKYQTMKPEWTRARLDTLRSHILPCRYIPEVQHTCVMPKRAVIIGQYCLYYERICLRVRKEITTIDTGTSFVMNLQNNLLNAENEEDGTDLGHGTMCEFTNAGQ